MKFIIDAQLPKYLSDFLKSKGFDSIHTVELPDQNLTTDKQIIDFSNQENRIVITKDNDFLESFLLNGQPKKLIIIRTGNIRNTDLLRLFELNFELIQTSIQENSLVEITRNELIIHE